LFSPARKNGQAGFRAGVNGSEKIEEETEGKGDKETRGKWR